MRMVYACDAADWDTEFTDNNRTRQRSGPQDQEGEHVRMIYKYPIELTDIQHVTLPCEAEILTVQFQHGNLFLWALIDQGEHLVSRRTIRIYETGLFGLSVDRHD